MCIDRSDHANEAALINTKGCQLGGGGGGGGKAREGGGGGHILRRWDKIR